MLKKGASVRVALGGGASRQLNVREWNKVIQTAGMTRGWKDAWAVFTTMKAAYLEGVDCRPDERTYTTVITILGGKKVEEIEEMDEVAKQERSARTALAIQLFEEIAESGLEQDQFAYNALMGVLSNAGDHMRARALLQRMRNSSAPPDLITYGKVTDACVRGGVPLAEVLQLFDEMQIVDRLKPDMDRFNELVAALCEQKMVGGAQKVLRDMRAAGAVPLRKTYLALLELYAREGLWRDAEALRKDMVAANLDPNGKDYECLIEAYVTGGRLAEGLSTLRQLAVCGARGSTRAYTVLIEAFGAAGKPEEAGRVFADMLNARTRPTVAAFTALLEAYGRNGKHLEAESTFQKMEKRNMEPTPRAWAALIGAYGRGGWFKKAKDTFAEMRRRGYQPGLIGYAALIEACGQGGWLREAAAAFVEMRQVCKLEPDREVCTAVLSALGKSEGNWPAAAPLLRALGGAADGDANGSEGACGLALPAHSVLTSPDAGELVWGGVGRAVGGLAKLGRERAESWANVLLDALWSLGLQKRAGRLVELSRGLGLYGSALVVTPEEWALDVRGLSVGGAEAMLLMWLGEVVIEFRRPQAVLPWGLAVLTGAGQEIGSGNGAVRRAVMARLAGLGSPFVVSREDDRRLVAPGAVVRQWLSSDVVVQGLALRDVPVPIELMRTRHEEEMGEAKRGPKRAVPGWRGNGAPAMVPSF